MPIIPMVVDPQYPPTRAHHDDGGLDLMATETKRIDPHSNELIGTGVKVAIPQDHVGYLHVRSSRGAKYDLGLANDVGVIDSGYRGEIMVALQNRGRVSQLVKAGERIAQLVVLPITTPVFQVVDSLDDTARGEGGFGSSGR